MIRESGINTGTEGSSTGYLIDPHASVGVFTRCSLPPHLRFQNPPTELIQSHGWRSTIPHPYANEQSTTDSGLDTDYTTDMESITSSNYNFTFKAARRFPPSLVVPCHGIQEPC
jgi:hypothetical protein